MDDQDDDSLAGRDLEIHRLCRQDPEFAAIWKDYGEVVEVLRRLDERQQTSPEILADYRRLRAELAQELRDWLEVRRVSVGSGGTADR